ncbi:MAG TPA: hypothetical protein VGM53_00400 [Streptosporangiaceae bacterium]|jgi:hypothetical protein
MFVLPAAVCAGLLASVLAAAPALAAGGPSMPSGPGGGTISGCSGATCYAEVWSHITLSGNSVSPSGGGGSPVAMPPPPCYLQPEFSGPEMYQMWQQSKNQRVGPNGTDPWGDFPGGAGAIKAHQNDTNGEWWGLVINLQVSGGCSIHPFIQWVRNGAPPPLPQVPQVDLADYAYNHMTIGPATLTFSPANRSIVNLPTYVWDHPPFNGHAFVKATLGNESATVTARPSKLQLTDNGGGLVYDTGCTATGSTATDPPKNAGPGTTPDCGVVFSAPGANSITGTLDWKPTGGGRTFRDIQAISTKGVTVAEIQSLNN